MKKRIFTLLSTLLFSSAYVFPQTWNGSVSSDWNTAANWTPNGVPASAGNVIINNGSAAHHPVLTGDVSIASLNMSAGILNLNSHTLTCSGNASFTGDSLLNGTVVSPSFTQVTKMRMGGKIIFDKTGSDYNYWNGDNKVYGDSLIVIWRGGTLYLENADADSIFTNFKIRLINGVIVAAQNNLLYVKNNMILDNSGGGQIDFAANPGSWTIINGNLVGQNFLGNTSDLSLRGVETKGNNLNGPFYCYNGTVTTCSFHGDFSLVADSSGNGEVYNSSFFGTNNLFQAGNFGSFISNEFSGTSIIRIANNSDYTGGIYEGSNKYFGNVQFEADATNPDGSTRIIHSLGQDSCFGNLSFSLKNNSSLFANNLGQSYVAGNVTIDAQGAAKWIEFSGNSGATFTIGGNFTVKHFNSLPAPEAPISKVILHNLYVSGSDTVGTFYCSTGDIDNSRFNGNFKLIADSSQAYFINNSSFSGADNLFQAGITQAQNSTFGKIGPGTTILRSALNSGSNNMRDGNNKFYNNAHWETYAAYPENVIIQQNFFGADSCWGDMTYLLKGNSALTTNGNGNNYVAGNVIIDGQGARKWVEFGGGAGNTFTVGGNFTVKNFTPLPIPGITITNVYLRNLYVSGTDTVGTFYCTSGDVTGSRFNGHFKLIADSAQAYFVSNSSFLGANNLFQAGIVETQNNKFGQAGAGTTILRSALSSGSNCMRDGNNKFFNNMQWETYAAYPGNVTIQQTFYGADSCWGNMNFVLKGNSGLTTNGNGHNYVSGNVTIDGQGARKWVEFGGGAGNTFTVGGNFTVKNFTPLPIPGITITNVYLRNLYVSGTDTVGTFYCTSGDVTGSRFNGHFKLIADSAQTYFVSNSSFLGENNLFQAGIVEKQNNKFGQAGAGTTILKSALSSGANNMRDGNNKFFGDAQWIAVAPSGGAILIQQTFFGPDTCLGNLTINLSGPASAGLGGNNLYIGKGLSLVNNGSGVIVHDNGVTAIHFIGTDTANYSFSGSGSSPSFINIEMNRKGGLKLMSPLTYTGSLVFTRGIIQSSLVNSLQIPNGAVVSSAWDSSYVDGTVQKTGNSAFTFPLGKNNVYAPISITAPSSATDAFTAQYFNHSAHLDGYDSSHVLGLIDHISRNEYWMLNRTAGTSSAKVTLSWKTARSGVVNKMTDLTVAHWDGSNWKDEGNGSTTGTNSEGTILSDNTISSFSPFTLASISISNPLPLRYISFVAQLNTNRTVLLQWETAEEENNDHFEIERSKDGNNWVRLGSMFPQSSHKYAYTDLLPEDGLNCYRIKEVDKDGKYFYSEIKFVRIGRINEFSMWPNPASDNLFVQIPFTGGTVELSDISGRLIGKY